MHGIRGFQALLRKESQDENLNLPDLLLIYS
jgi:hypothetical protein